MRFLTKVSKLLHFHLPFYQIRVETYQLNNHLCLFGRIMNYLTRLNKIILKSKKIASSFCLFICDCLLIINKKSLSVSQNLETKFTLDFYIYTSHVIYFKLKDKYLINYFSLQANIVSKSLETSSKLLMP